MLHNDLSGLPFPNKPSGQAKTVIFLSENSCRTREAKGGQRVLVGDGEVLKIGRKDLKEGWRGPRGDQPSSFCPARRGETTGTFKVVKSQKSPFYTCLMSSLTSYTKGDVWRPAF